MKKLKLLAAASAICTGLQSQPYTGIDTYQHFSSNIRLTDGAATTVFGGFILGGYDPLPLPSNPYNLYIDHTDDQGGFTTANDFSWQYKFLADNTNACSPTLQNATNGYGMSVIEITTGGAASYIMTAAFNRGCLYSTLDNAGNPLSSSYFTFPTNATNPTKPLITAAAAVGRYYISGSYQMGAITHMYVLKLTATGGITWSSDYTLGSPNSELIPAAIVESPYAPASAPELVLVGSYNVGGSLSREGFFARLKGNNGGVLQFATYGTASNTKEYFTSITVANSPTPGSPGYVIGGSSDGNASRTAWMLKVKPTGGILWTSLIKPSLGPTGAVMGVKERYSAAYSSYEYYGTSNDNNGMTVFKLDAAGGAFSQFGNTNNEFIYNDNLGNPAFPAAISYLDNGSVNDGIHVFGTNNSFAGSGDYFMVRACFNGAAGNTGCTSANVNLTSGANVTPGPGNMNAPTIAQNAGLTNCTNFSFYGGNVAITTLNPCDNTILPTGGNQNRTSAVTGIKSNSSADKFMVSPNPVTDKLTISYAANTAGETVSVSLYNNLGQLVSPALTSKTLRGNTELELDLGKMNINSGIYFITVQADGFTNTKKIVYTK